MFVQGTNSRFFHSLNATKIVIYSEKKQKNSTGIKLKPNYTRVDTSRNMSHYLWIAESTGGNKHILLRYHGNGKYREDNTCRKHLRPFDFTLLETTHQGLKHVAVNQDFKWNFNLLTNNNLSYIYTNNI